MSRGAEIVDRAARRRAPRAGAGAGEDAGARPGPALSDARRGGRCPVALGDGRCEPGRSVPRSGDAGRSTGSRQRSTGSGRAAALRLALTASIAVVFGVLGCLFVPPIRDFAQTVIRVATNTGVLVIEAEDQDLEIGIKRDRTDQGVIARIAKGNKEVIELRAGELTIEASLPGGDRLTTTELTLTRGSSRLLTARLLLARQVLVSQPVERQVTDYEEFTGKARGNQKHRGPLASQRLPAKNRFPRGGVCPEGTDSSSSSTPSRSRQGLTRPGRARSGMKSN